MFKFISLLLITLITLSGNSTASGSGNREITLDDIYRHGTFSARTVSGLRSMNDGIHYTTMEGGTTIRKFSYRTGEEVEVIFSVDQLPGNEFSSFNNYEFCSDERLILFTTGREQIYRHSFRADFFIWNIEQETVTPLSPLGKTQLATFSPDGRRVAFVFENNLYFKDLESNREVQVTTDGKENEIINGAPDWVYEEEFSFNKAFAWSPDSRKLAFYRFDESHVKMFNMTIYGGLYPHWYQFKYPKAGEENALVTIHVYDIHEGSFTEMDIGEETDQYIPRIKWTRDPSKLAIYRLNRLQNHIEVLLADAVTGNSEVLWEETNRYFIRETSDNMITFLEDGKHFLVMSERSGWMHFYLYDMNGRFLNAVTSGEWEVDRFTGIDHGNGVLYYSSSETSPLQRNVYSISLNGRNKRRLTPEDGTNNAVFSNGFRYYINYHSDANTPANITLHDDSGELIRVLEDNSRLKEVTAEYGFSKKEFFTFTTSEGIDLNGYIIKPPDFDENREYPLFMYVYGGPGHQAVRDSYTAGAWYQMLAQKGYVIVCVDNRGTGARGEEFMKSTYLQLGKYETIDQIEAAKYMGAKSWIDESRIGIFGWSYGGYMVGLCLTKGADVFKLGVSGAPVTNWRFYDTIYTERYMRTPQENADGYDDNSPINHVDKLNGHFMIIHGTADDNVHLQNTIEMVDRMIAAGKHFELLLYPNHSHGIRGNAAQHMYERITDFVLENL
ncbi:MAG: S9 family peptidase [Marinilabiliales bacterium]|nr:MAG: S9 family peptidase [Marinilabiliales bacterium]